MTKAVFFKNGRGLWAQCAESQKLLASIKDNKEVIVEVRAARNPKHHRLFFALLQKVCDSGAWDYDKDMLLEWVKHRTGHIRMIEVNGRRIYTSKSIAFESMGQDKFRDFFNRAVFYLCTEILKEQDWQAVRDEIWDIFEAPYNDSRDAA